MFFSSRATSSVEESNARFLKSAEDMGHDFGLGSIFLLVVRRFW